MSVSQPQLFTGQQQQLRPLPWYDVVLLVLLAVHVRHLLGDRHGHADHGLQRHRGDILCLGRCPVRQVEIFREIGYTLYLEITRIFYTIYLVDFLCFKLPHLVTNPAPPGTTSARTARPWPPSSARTAWSTSRCRPPAPCRSSCPARGGRGYRRQNR